MPREQQTLTIASPFKFGFYAGIGFFFASALMSCMGVVFVVLVGFGSLLGLNRAVAPQPIQIAPQGNAVQSSYSTPVVIDPNR